MVDSNITVGTGLVVLGSKEILTKLLGPTADYIGGEIKGLIEKCNINLDSIFLKAKRKIGNKIDQPGVVSPRVLKHVIDEGRFCVDDLTAEYIAGVLASSRTDQAADDRGVNLITLLQRLSAYQIKSHYILYHVFHELFYNKTYTWRTTSPQSISISHKSFFDSMGFDEKEIANAESILNHILFGLLHEGLIKGCMPKTSHKFNDKTETSLGFHPSVRGIELYSWAHGNQNISESDFLRTSFENIAPSINLPIDISIGGYNLGHWNVT